MRVLQFIDSSADTVGEGLDGLIDGIKSIFDSSDDEAEESRVTEAKPQRVASAPLPPVELTVLSRINDGTTERAARGEEGAFVHLLRKGSRYRLVQGQSTVLSTEEVAELRGVLP